MKSNKQNNNNKFDKASKRQPKSNHVRSKCDDVSSGRTASDVHVSGNINDANYYFSNELLKKQITNVSFNTFNGVPLTAFNSYGGFTQSIEVPTTMILRLNPSAGFTDEETGLGTALNLTGLKLYTELSANNAKTTNYAPQDVTTLFLALGSAISLSSHIARVFGLAYLYSQRNRTYPRGIIEALGVDYDDLMANYANYRVRYNAIVNAASGIAFPSNVPYFHKCRDIYSGVYLDMEGSALAQTYAFTPYSVWMFDETGSEEGTVLRTTEIHSGTTVRMEYLLDTLNDVFASLLTSSTLNFIYADILRLADHGMSLYTFEMIPDNYVVIPQYNPEIRRWINNATPIGAPRNEVSTGYTQSNNVYPDADTNKIIYRPQFTISSAAAAVDRVMNFDDGDPTVDQIVEATRLMSHLQFLPGETISISAALPDHYVVNISIYHNASLQTAIANYYISDASALPAMLLTAFDWFPILPYDVVGTGWVGLFGDLNYYTTLGYDYLSTLQDTTYYGLFEIR